MRVLWFSWKDIGHPDAGGAEFITDTILKELVSHGHEVCLLTARYDGSADEDMVRGYKIIRAGGRYGVYWSAFKVYRKRLRDWPDLVIDEMNTIPFFCSLYVRQKTVLFVHQLCRRVWFYQMIWPFSLFGFLAESIYLRILSGNFVITVSESTKKDLQRFGFVNSKIHIVTESVSLKPLKKIKVKESIKKVLIFGSIRPMKRALHVLRAFEIVKMVAPHIELVVAGCPSGYYGKKFLRLVSESMYKDDIKLLGFIKEEEKEKIFAEADILCVTSVKEGWGLVVTEANTQGTPAIVYGVDGLRDSVVDGETGLVVDSDIASLANGLTSLILDKGKFRELQKNCHVWSRKFTPEATYKSFMEALEKVSRKSIA